MNLVDVWIDDVSLGGSKRVGTLERTVSRTGTAIGFTYSADWLQDRSGVHGFALDRQLPLHAGRQFARAGAAHVTPAFVDCSPDRWGKRLMERREAIEAREQQRKPRLLRDWDYLVGVNDEARMGALRLIDPESARYVDDHALSAPPMTALRELEAVAARLEDDNADIDQQGQWVRQLLAPGASLGGARPKASFRDPDGALWIAKFPSSEDRRDVGLWEFLVHRLSVAAGIPMPEARALPLSDRGHTFAVRRFDRAGTSRRAYVSAMTLLDADESDGRSYLEIATAIEAYATSTTIGPELGQLFRRVLFNILVGNRDDHLRNHGFLREGNGWRLSPAFDVNPNPDRDSHVLAIDESNPFPDSSLLLDVAPYFRLNAKDATRIANEVREAVRDWETLARQMRLPKSEIAQMTAVIDPDR